VNAEIITIGTELLLGDILDTNTRTIARRLREAGIDLYRTTTVGDNPARIVEAMRAALGRADFVITAGGLGPTVDDPTREAAAEAVGVKTAFHEDLWQEILERFARFGRTPTENNRRQAYLPVGARAIHNPVGTAPGFAVEYGSSVLIALPGVPAELEWLIDHEVIPILQDRAGPAVRLRSRVLHTAGVGESWVDERIQDLEAMAEPTVGVLAHPGRIDIRIAAKLESPEQALAVIGPVETELRWRLGQAVFGADADTLEGVTLAALGAHGWSLATVERGTAGSLAAALAGAGSGWAGGWVLPTGAAPEALADAERSLERTGAKALVVLSLEQSERSAGIAVRLQTPDGSDKWSRTYGGPATNAAAWAVAIALDLVRRKMS
jgi:competence/damage-inducible protein CinA-like protein